MSILASLARAYDRLPDAPPFGYSAEKIGFIISLNADGTVANVIDVRTGDGKKRSGRSVIVPEAFKRPGTTPRPFYLWDNANYALGGSVTDEATDERFKSFREKHLQALQHETDEGLVALRAFLTAWEPRNVESFLAADAKPDAKIVFALEHERKKTLLHERPRSRELWSEIREAWRAVGEKTADDAVCLVLGERKAIARTHAPIKGIPSKGGKDADSIVSYNADAFTSYGHEQGDNAPVSEAAAFAYTTALNRFLERDSGHRIQIGDASTVFWADAWALEPELASEAEAVFADLFSPAGEETAATKKIADKLTDIRAGKRLKAIEPKLADVRFHVLGLAPNAARLSVRFYFEDSFGVLSDNYQRYLQDMAFEPWPHDRKLSIVSSVLRTAPARIEQKQLKFDRDQISPRLAGELLRSILTGSRFPGGLLPLLLLRVRSDHVLDATRIALIKGSIVRAMRLDGCLPEKPDGTPMEDYLVRSDPNDPNDARRLGRLFALIERAQLTALGDDINATVKDKFLSAAAATPRQVFSGLIENAENHHLKRLRNGHSDAAWVAESAKKSGLPVAQVARRVGAALNADIGRLAGTFGNGFPAQHTIDQQGLFLVGYYQERYGRKKDDADGPDDIVASDEPTNNGEE
jgi:CRISPR-associated protein Csd1